MPPAFDYKMDRHYKVLRREDMFPNPVRPGNNVPNEHFWMSNALFSSGLRVALGNLAPGGTHENTRAQNEHLLLHVSGDLEYRFDGKTYRLSEHDVLFTPVTIPYRIVNVGAAPGSFFSCASMYGTWDRSVPRIPSLDPYFAHHRLAPFRSTEPDEAHELAAQFDGTLSISKEIRATSTRVRVVTIGSARAVPPSASFDEHVIVGMEGKTIWRIDGNEFVIGPQDLLFVPAWTAYSYRAAGSDVARFFDCAVYVDGLREMIEAAG